jgi:hypothetical protein
MCEQLTIREAAANLISEITNIRKAFLRDTKELDLKARGFAITDALARIGDAAAKPAQILPMMEAVVGFHKVLGAPGHYGYSHPIGIALKRLYDAHGALADAIDAERSKEGGAE